MTKKWCSILATAALASAQLVAQGAARRSIPSPRASILTRPKPRLLVMTDIANEPDDQMSMVRLLVYSNQFDVEGLVATTSTWMRNRVRPDVIRSVIDAYEQVQPNLLKHAAGISRRAAALRARRRVRAAGVRHGARSGPDKTSPGAELILQRRGQGRRAAALGAGVGRHEHARAGAAPRARDAHAGASSTRSSRSCASTRSPIRTTPGPWIRREFPTLHYIASPSTQDGEQYYLATWTGISGDRFYRNAPGADFTTFTDDVGEREHPRARARSASSIRTRAASTKATRRRSSA